MVFDLQHGSEVKPSHLVSDSPSDSVNRTLPKLVVVGRRIKQTWTV